MLRRRGEQEIQGYTAATLQVVQPGLGPAFQTMVMVFFQNSKLLSGTVVANPARRLDKHIVVLLSRNSSL